MLCPRRVGIPRIVMMLYYRARQTKNAGKTPVSYLCPLPQRGLVAQEGGIMGHNTGIDYFNL